MFVWLESEWKHALTILDLLAGLHTNSEPLAPGQLKSPKMALGY